MTPKNVVWRIALLLAGAGCGLAISAHSEISAWIGSSPKDCGGLQQAMASAVNNNVREVALTSPDPSKYFSVASPGSCLSGLAVANLDLSRLIPDPQGMFSAGIGGAIDELKKLAFGTACAAARNSVGGIIDKYNSAIASANGTLDIQNQIDSAIGEESRQVLERYTMSWETPQSSDVLAGVPLPSNATTTMLPVQQRALPTQGPSAKSIQATPEQMPQMPTGLGAVIFGR